jgi:hypothetical protein
VDLFSLMFFNGGAATEIATVGDRNKVFEAARAFHLPSLRRRFQCPHLDPLVPLQADCLMQAPHPPRAHNWCNIRLC